MTKNGKMKMENQERDESRRQFSVIQFPKSVEKNCPACGAEARRETAQFCQVCGKLLMEDYQPLDTLRSSNRLQGQSFLVENARREEITNLFPKNENAIIETAWACLVYSFVPYLGILFVPLAFGVGVFGFAVSFRQPNSDGRKLALVSVGLSVVMLTVQIFLWWLLYFIPEIGKQI